MTTKNEKKGGRCDETYPSEILGCQARACEQTREIKSEKKSPFFYSLKH